VARRNAAQWAELVAKWKRSGLTAKKFGAREGVRPKSLSWWSWRLGRSEVISDESAASKTALPAFLPVHVVEREFGAMSTNSPDRHVDILVDERSTVRVLPGFDEQTLRRVLNVLSEKVAR
jgi:transposase